MNAERIEKLINYLKDIPDQKFDFSNWFSTIENKNEDDCGDHYLKILSLAKEKKSPPCNTAACIAGHTVLLFWEEAKNHIVKGCSVSIVAQEILGIDYFTKNDLFVKGMDYATKQDAIQRLEHILDNNTLDNYDWHSEKWFAENN